MVVVFGSINLDLVARVPRIPAPGETLAGTAFDVAPGGKGANQAHAARHAGAQVVMYGATGNDSFAAAALVNLVAAGVELELAHVAAPTGVALINVDDRGENAITVVAGANSLARSTQVPDARLCPSNTVLVQLEVPLAEIESLAARAHARGARVVLNAAPAASLPDALLRNVDVLVVNEHEAKLCAGGDYVDAAAFIAHMHKAFAVNCVVTLGARGAVAMDGGALVHVEPPAVTVVDSTGAGDAFTGALAAALDGGASTRDALMAGVQAGASCCTHRGAQRDTSGGAPSG